MKKFAFLLLIALTLTLAACSGNGEVAGAADDASSKHITMLDAGEWPANEYTEGLPVPTGTVSWAMLDEEHRNCSISLTGTSDAEHSRYLALLKEEGFSVVEDVSEEIRGQDYVSIGTLLSNGEKSVSISCIPDCFTIYITWEG